MTTNTNQASGRTKNFKFDRGGTPAEMGPFIGRIVNNVDATRTGAGQKGLQFGQNNARFFNLRIGFAVVEHGGHARQASDDEHCDDGQGNAQLDDGVTFLFGFWIGKVRVLHGSSLGLISQFSLIIQTIWLISGLTLN
jgi:hypothetical protein